MNRLYAAVASTAAFTTTLLCQPALAVSTTTTPKGEATPISAGADGAVQNAGSGGNLARTFVGLAIVLAVIYGLHWVLKQIRSSRDEATSGDGLASVASIGLGPNRAVHLVRTGDEFVLLGVAEHSVNSIATYTRDEALGLGLIPAAGDVDAHVAPVVKGVGAVVGAVRATLERRPLRETPLAAEVAGTGVLRSLRERTVR